MHSLTPPDFSDISSQGEFSYQQWKDQKLSRIYKYQETDQSSLFIEINNANHLNATLKNNLLTKCAINSFCLYRIIDQQQQTKSSIHSLASQLGLNTLDTNICADSDQLTSITRVTHTNQHEYIPYSNKRLSWHTDGYYNLATNTINSMLLHCVSPAKEGGESHLMDHELIYLLLREENPKFIVALMQPDAMTIPANILNDEVIRAEQTGPVFSTNSDGQLHMRYSARKRNIVWKNDTITSQARAFIEDILSSDSHYIVRHTLQAGEGLICRNILHRRTSFVDYAEPEKKRLLYRGRYYDHLKTPS